MDLKRFLQSWEGMRTENRFHRALALGLAIALLMALWKVLSQDPVVTLEPPINLSKAVAIHRGKASVAYRKTWALFVAEMLGNVTPGNVEFVKKAVVPLLSPSIHHQVKKALYQQAQEIKEGGLTVRFSPRQTLYEPSTGKFFILGQQVTRAPAGPPQKQRRVYEVRLKIRSYRPRVTHLTAYTGQPKTQKRLKGNSSG